MEHEDWQPLAGDIGKEESKTSARWILTATLATLQLALDCTTL